MPRFKDREDMVKTYYLCGVVLCSVTKLVKSKKNKEYLKALDYFESTPEVAAKASSLPTRHCNLKTGGGLRYASKRYYEVFTKMEDHFFCTVVMRRNFGLPNVNIITNIKDELLSDIPMIEDFLSIMQPEMSDIGRELYEQFVERQNGDTSRDGAGSPTHGNSRKSQTPRRCRKEKQKNTSNPKHEALRAARKAKKLELSRHKHDVIDIVESEEDVAAVEVGESEEDTAVEEESETAAAVGVVVASREDTYGIGDVVTAIEGTGSAMQRWKGTVVEIDLDSNAYVICCEGVPGYNYGYNMIIPFEESSSRINQPVHTGQRKRRRNHKFL